VIWMYVTNVLWICVTNVYNTVKISYVHRVIS
jgi:hypothetical protein